MPIIKPRPFDKDDEDIEDNFDNLKDHIEDKDFKLWMPARVFNTRTVGGGGGATEGCYVTSPYWQLADGSTTEICTEHYRPQYWFLGEVRATVYYTGDTGSTNNIRFQVRLTAFTVNGTALTTETGDLTVTTTTSQPGPAVADELLTFDPFTSRSMLITATYPYMTVIVRRIGADAADTYAGNARILGVMLRFYPTRR